MATAAQRALLRLYIDDPENGGEFFDNGTLDTLISAASDDLHVAASRAWGIKAARVNDWYLVQVDGALFSRQQVFEHCMSMVDFHEKRSEASIVSVRMSTGSELTSSDDDL